MSEHMATRVNELRWLLDAEAPAIAVSFSDDVTAENIGRAKTEGLDVAELRIDRYGSWATAHVVDQVQRFGGVPTIATVRAENEGGDWKGTDVDRAALYRAVLPHVSGIDIELASVESSPELAAIVDEARQLDKVVIISNHNFDHTPTLAELEDMATRAKGHGADVVKLSAMTHSHADARTLVGFTLRNAELGLIVIAMGAHGSMSRVFFPALGSKLTYAHAGRWVVSGQLAFDETFYMLRRFYPEFNDKKINDLELLEDA